VNHYNSLDDFLLQDEPSATFHDAELLSLFIDYDRKELLSEWIICVGDPDADRVERERRRRCRLRFKGLCFWVVEPPRNLEDKSRLPWLTSDGPLAEAKTAEANRLAAILRPDAFGMYLFFSNWNAFAYCGAESGSFEWTD
jgi:hypothetical protein